MLLLSTFDYDDRSAAPAKDKNKKHDLSKWTYAQIRDTINTSSGRSPESVFAMLTAYAAHSGGKYAAGYFAGFQNWGCNIINGG